VTSGNGDGGKKSSFQGRYKGDNQLSKKPTKGGVLHKCMTFLAKLDLCCRHSA
jgi:hypothetical protein